MCSDEEGGGGGGRETAQEARMNDYLESKRQKYLTKGDKVNKARVSEQLEEMTARNKKKHEEKTGKAKWKGKSLRLEKKLRTMNTKKRRYKTKMCKYKDRNAVTDAQAREASDYFKYEIAARDEVINRYQNPKIRLGYR